ncbi:DUF1496 domain-containing protein [Collimonas pratensis]|uniref:DUF1496 domain-containing protein n=1 Tax=Collimonas pratensis TaxID=279113 RepID=UPI00143D7AD0|nr:DUF1496 domain-containing protein [Collimonas pratensis]NKI68105.1 DUF1496 domain-containing protein [Collimonas pratensis]
MADGTEFKGNVGQAVIGNVNEAPRLNNIVQIIGSGSNEVEPKPVKVLTGLQRKAIFAKVEEVVAASGLNKFDVYNVIKNEFGVETIKEVPLDNYKDAMDLLNQSLAEATGLEGAAQESVTEKVTTVAHTPATCLGCIEKSASFNRLQRAARAQLFALVACIGVCGWLLYKIPTTADAATILPSTAENKCYFENKIYSIGSTVKTVSGVTQECTATNGQTPAMWISSKRGR